MKFFRYADEVIAGNCPEIKGTKFIYDYVGIHRPKDFVKKICVILQREFPDIRRSEVRQAADAAYAEYANIDTKGEWATYTFYFESAVSAETSLTVQLGLGKYNSEYTVGLTTGYAFFDNLLLEEIDGEVYTSDWSNKAYRVAK